MPPIGTINLHASLLPKYRGAAPINWAVINGEKETGVTTFLLKHEIDTGNILFQKRIRINDNDNAGTVHDNLMAIGSELILSTVNALASGNYKELEQDLGTGDLPHAPKIFKNDCQINWSDSNITIYNKIRGLSPYPTAWTLINNKILKIYSASMMEINHGHEPGKILTDHKTYLKFATKDGFINVDELQMEGKKRMVTTDFLRGIQEGQLI